MTVWKCFVLWFGEADNADLLCSSVLWLIFLRGKEEPPSCSPNQHFMTVHRPSVTSCHIRPYSNINSACYSIKPALQPATSPTFLWLQLYFKVLAGCISAHFFTLCVCVCFVQGHSRAGEVQDHYDSLLQRSHGEHGTPAEQADWIIRLTSPPLCARSVPFWLTPFKSSLFCPSQGIILVYDITDEKSFENIQNWMKSIKEVRLLKDKMLKSSARSIIHVSHERGFLLTAITEQWF